MVLATGTEGEAVALAARASSMLSASNYSCCLRYPAIRIRSALVSDLYLLPHHSTIIPAAATLNTLNQIHAKAEAGKRQYLASSALLIPILSLPLAPNQLGLAATLLRANAAAVKLNGDQEEAALWLAATARALAHAPHPMHSWMLPGVMNDAANRFGHPAQLQCNACTSHFVGSLVSLGRHAEALVFFAGMPPSLAMFFFLTTILWAEGLHYSLIIMGSLTSPDVQEELSRHNISAMQRGRRVRNAGVSIAYNAGVMCCWRFEPWCWLSLI
jgi:hypothetical protein